MAKAAPIIGGFTSGVLSPLLAGQVDLKYYKSGLRKARNFLLTKQGPARRRPGTRFVAEVKNSANRTWLWEFEFNVEQAYVLEFGHQYIRFYANHGVVESSPGVPLEVATPYSAADLTADDGTFALRFVQSNDVLYIVHLAYAPRKLTRTGPAAFSLSVVNFDGGPFQDLDPEETRTVYASAATGTGITLTASSAIFLSDHIGSLFKLEQKDVNGVPQWEAAKSININDVRRSDGKNYKALNTATTGTIKPTHSRGASYDGNTGVQWDFLDPGYGWVKITAIGGGGTTATADVLSRIPDQAVGVANASTRWAFGHWSDYEGWPSVVTFFRERLCFARDQYVWQSVTGDFENFAAKDDGGVVVADSAITSDVTSDRANRVEWIAPADEGLLCGTAGDEHRISEITTAQALGPGNVKAKKQSEYGSRHVQPARIGDGVVFVQKAGRKLRELMFSSDKEGYIAPDVTVLAEHVTRSGVIDMSYQQEPDSILWCVLENGQLAALTLDREQDIHGWHPHRIGGFADLYTAEYAKVESVATIPTPDGGSDEAWFIVQRYIDGGIKRYVEFLEAVHEEDEDPDDVFHVDCGLSLDNVVNSVLNLSLGAETEGSTNISFSATSAFVAGDVGKFIHYRYFLTGVTGKKYWFRAVAEITEFVDAHNVLVTILQPWPTLEPVAAGAWRKTATTLSGLDHLEGQEVQVWANGAAHPNKTVVGGSITLDRPASKAHVGLACPAVLQPMPLEAAAADGTAQGKTARVSRCAIRFHETMGCKYGRDEDLKLDEIMNRSAGDQMNEPTDLFTGDKIVDWPDGYDTGALLTIFTDLPAPVTVVALMPQLTVQDNR